MRAAAKVVAIIVASLLGVMVLGLVAMWALLTLNPMQLVQWSHIQANAPAQSEFDALPKRDLESFFQKRAGRNVSVEYEYLRRGPTQAGVGFPKYYLWVRLSDGGTVVEDGAVSVAALDQKRFVVYHYLTRQTIEAQPNSITSVFPGPVCDRIREKLR